MKTRESAYNAKYWLHKFEEDLYRVRKFLENVDESTPEFPFVEVILSEYIHKKEKSIARKKEYLDSDSIPVKMYRGFCRNPELIENYDLAKLDNFQDWECHHRLETHFSDGTPRPADACLSRHELIALNMYYDRPPEELIYMKKAEHHILHGHCKKLSEGTRRKMSESHKGMKCKPIDGKKVYYREG